MSLCLEKAGKEWADSAYAYLVEWVRTVAKTGVPFSAEDLTDAATRKGIRAHDARAWGGVFQRAARRGVIRRSSATFARRNGHGAPIFGWEKD